MARYPNLPRYLDGTLQFSTDLGGYPIAYEAVWLGGDERHALCPDCARGVEAQVDPDEKLVGSFINYEDAHLYCDACNERILSAYAEDEHEG